MTQKTVIINGEEVPVVPAKAEEEIKIEVRDNGIGINIRNTDEVFRMFSRFTDRNRTGGIGLYLVKSAVDKLSGKIFINNKEVGWTSVVVELPYQTTEIAV